MYGGLSMNFQQLKHFKALAEIRHYAKTAKYLCISQSYLSTSILNLEKEIGFSLFDRNNRNVVLNRNGTIFLEFVNRLLELLDEGIEYVREMNENYSYVNIGILPEVSSLLGPKFFSSIDLNHENERIKVNVKKISKYSKDLFQDLKNFKLDIIFTTKDNINFDKKILDYSSACPSNPRETLNNIVLVPVLKQKFVLLVSKNHELSRYESIRISQALNYPFIKYTDNTSLDDYVQSLFEITNNRIYDVSYTVDTYELAAGLAASGLGIAIVPDLPYLDYIDAHKINISYPVYSRTIYMAIIKNDHINPQTKKVYNEVFKYAKKNNLISKNFKYKLHL